MLAVLIEDLGDGGVGVIEVGDAFIFAKYSLLLYNLTHGLSVGYDIQATRRSAARDC